MLLYHIGEHAMFWIVLFPHKNNLSRIFTFLKYVCIMKLLLLSSQRFCSESGYDLSELIYFKEIQVMCKHAE